MFLSALGRWSMAFETRAALWRQQQRGFWTWFAHSPMGVSLMQVPLLPTLLVRSPRWLLVDVSGLVGFGGFVLTAATLWFTFRQQF